MIVTDNRKVSEALGLRLWRGDAAELRETEAAIASRAFAARLLEGNTPKLRLIQLTSAGYEGVDLETAKRKGIAVCNAADVYSVGMAEYVVYALLSHAKRFHRSIKNRTLRPFRNYHYITELAGKTVGILGAGSIGTQIAKRLEAFDMKVLGYARAAGERPHFDKVFTEEGVTLLLPQCDYIVNCLPLTIATEGIVCAEWLSLMKPTVAIVNVGRRKTINDRDLLSFLRSHKDATAVLDMFERVPNPFTNPYRRLSNVLVLPGVTAVSREIDERLQSLCREQIDHYNKGERLLNRIV